MYAIRPSLTATLRSPRACARGQGRRRAEVASDPRRQPGDHQGLGSSSFGTVDRRQHGERKLTPGAGPATMGDLEGRPFGALWSDPGREPGVSGDPVLERAHGLVQRVALHGLLPRPTHELDDLVV